MKDEDFLLVVETFRERHGLSATTFGLWAMDDSRFVFDLRKGRKCYPSTRGRVLRFMEHYANKQALRSMHHS